MDIGTVALLLLLAPQTPPPPPPPPNPFRAGQARDAVPDRKGTAVIRGHVFTAEGRPLRRAQLRLTSPDLQNPPRAATGLEGEYEIGELPAGRYTLHITRSGYISLQYGQSAPREPGQPIELKDGAILDKVNITMMRAGVISGRVVDETGEPAAGVDIWAMQEQFFRGRKRIVPVTSALAHIATDDAGQYRLTGLNPGEYLVMGTLRETWMSDEKEPQMIAYAPTYFPGTANPLEGVRVKVDGGHEVGAIDFSLAPLRAATLSGTAVGLDGTPISGQVMLSQEIYGPMGGRIWTSTMARVAADGTWRMPDVPPGEYSLRAADSARGESAFRRITVEGQDIGGIHLAADPGALVSGRVVTDTGEPLPAGRFTVVTTPLEMGGAAPRPTPGKDDGVIGNGAFTRRSLSGEVIARIQGLPRGWALKHVQIGDRDYEGIPMSLPAGGQVRDVTMVISNRLADIRGAVTDAQGRPVLATVLVFSTDSARWAESANNQRMARTDADGRYRFEGLRPGEFFVIAIDSMQRWQLNDPDFLRAHQERATKITLPEGTMQTDLRLVR